MLGIAQEMLSQVAQYTEPRETIQSVCHHPEQTIELHNEIRDLNAQHFLLLTCDHSRMQGQIWGLENDFAEARRRPASEGTSGELQEKLAIMTQEAQNSGEEVSNVWTELANILTLAVRAVPAAPQAKQHVGQNFLDSQDISGSDQTQRSGWIAHLRMVMQCNPGSFRNEHLKMLYACNHLRGVALGQFLPHVQDDRTIELKDLPAFIPLLGAAFGDPDWVATVERIILDVKQRNHEFSHYYLEFQVIATDLDWNQSALKNALRMGLSKVMNDSFTYCDMPEDLRTFVAVCQEREN